jgi:hypothetical protein
MLSSFLGVLPILIPPLCACLPDFVTYCLKGDGRGPAALSLLVPMSDAGHLNID